MQPEKGGYIFEELGCTVSDDELEQVEKELKLLSFEKRILEEILFSIQNDESSRSIDPADREKIYRKYEDQLRSIEERMNKCKLIVKLRRLELGRMKLLSILKDRLEYIDREIKELRSALGKQKKEAKPKLEAVDSKQTRSRTVEAKQVEMVEQVEEKDDLQKLQEDIIATLEKLEQLDLEL
jgi:hypothetical protein